MSAESNEWISIGDLMAGVVGVVMLMFVSAAVVSTAQANHGRLEERRRREADEEAANQSREQARRTAELRRASTQARLEALRNEIIRAGLRDVVRFDIAAKRMSLPDATFDSGSACVSHLARRALATISQDLRNQLEERDDSSIRVEGHTDSARVVPRLDRRRRCALFDDNFTLSAARAREARNALTGGWPEPLRRRVTLAGLGDTRPLVADLASPVNRRVEISIQDGDAARSEPEPTRAAPTPR